MATIKYFSNYLANKVNLPETSIPEIKKMYHQSYPFNDKTYQNINDSITSIASIDPILAYGLHVNILASNSFDKFSSMIEGNAIEDKLFLNFISEIDDKMLPYLEKTILELAKKHGIITCFRVRHYLKEKIIADRDMENSLDELKKQLDGITKTN